MQAQDSLDNMMRTTARASSAPGSGRAALPPQPFYDARVEAQPAATIYKPDGSFQSLVIQNKMAPTSAKALQGQYARTIRHQKKHYIPNTTIFSRGRQHIAGRSYGEATRRCFDTDYSEHAQTSPIPSNPEKNRKIEHYLPPGSFVTHHFGDKKYQVPGYTGHITGVRDKYAVTYGNLTNVQMEEWAKTNPREYPGQVDGYAKTIKPRHTYILNSNPLPGGVLRSKPPTKMVSGHLTRLQYY